MYPEPANAIWQGSQVFHGGCPLGRNVRACPTPWNSWVQALKIPLSHCMTSGKSFNRWNLSLAVKCSIKVVSMPHSCWEGRRKAQLWQARGSVISNPFLLMFPRLQLAVIYPLPQWDSLINSWFCVVCQVFLMSNRTQEAYQICHGHILVSGAGFSPRREATFCKTILPYLVLTSQVVQASPPPSSSKSSKTAMFLMSQTEKLIDSYKHSTHPRGAL